MPWRKTGTMNLEDLKDPKLQEQLKAAKTPEEMLALAKQEGVELSDEQIEAISGGSIWEDDYSCDTYRYY